MKMNKLAAVAALAAMSTTAPHTAIAESSSGNPVTSSSGAVVTDVDGDKVYTFNSAGTLTLGEDANAWILIVGGGGAGGGVNSDDGRVGGGGAGEYVEVKELTLSAGTYAITVGAGGQTTAANGEASILAMGETELYRALGGGGGGTSWSNAAKAGGSGGGANKEGGGVEGKSTAKDGVGHDGGSGAGGGGGGAGLSGSSGALGGVGVSCLISGELVGYAGGGNGQISSVADQGGVLYGGGVGSKTGNGGNGVDGLGGGGGAGKPNGGHGGRGVAIIRIRLSQTVYVEPIELDDLPYTGGLQKAAIEGCDDYTITANEGGTDVGDYAVTVRLTQDRVWADGVQDAERSFGYKITPVPATWVTEPSVGKAQWCDFQTPTTVDPGVANGGSVAVKLDGNVIAAPYGELAALESGNHSLRFAVVPDGNHTAIEKEIGIMILGSSPGRQKANVVKVTGARVERCDGDVVIVFTNAAESVYCAFESSMGVKARILAVGGGGSGGRAGIGRQGGGGAGGFVETNKVRLAAGKYFVRVGHGGRLPTTDNTVGANGGDTCLEKLAGGVVLCAHGGGGGGCAVNGKGRDGACGGGSGAYQVGGKALEYDGVKEGCDGSDGKINDNGGGGGGGAGGKGENAFGLMPGISGGAGGVGKMSDITGEEVYYAGGGAGTGLNANGTGGIGGGGDGGKPGEDGLGGGGGGGAKGGSGTLILRFRPPSGLAIIMR